MWWRGAPRGKLLRMTVPRDRGMVLIVSLLLVMTIAVVGRAAVALNPGLLQLSRSSVVKDHARRAADSGLEYALNRLRQEPAWRGDANAVTINSAGLHVVEDQGNVVGLVTLPEGTVCQFRLRFNYQDGGAGGDGFSDPATAMWIDHPYLSVNNNLSLGNAPVPLGDGPNFSVTDPSTGRHEVPSKAVSVIVEGRAGPGLRSHLPTDSNAPPSGRVETTYVEACYSLAVDQAVDNAALMAGGSINVTVPPGSRVQLAARGSNDDVKPRLRSKGSIEITDTTGSPADLTVAREEGEIGRDAMSAPGFVGNLVGQGATFAQENVGDGSDFYNLQWDQVRQADIDPAEAIHIPAGTYVMWEDETLHYYDRGFEDYQAYMADPGNHSDPGVELTWGFPQIRDPANYAAEPRLVLWPETGTSGQTVLTINFDRDTRVLTSPSGVTDFTVMPRGGAAFSPTDDSLTVPGAADSWSHRNVQVRVTESVLSTPGDTRFLSYVVGNAGTVTTEGEMTIVAPSSRMQNNLPDAQGLNLYVQGDINLSTYQAQNDSYGVINFRGLIYSWSDFHSYTGHPNVSTDRWNTSTYSGTVVAYGGDPGTGTPGSGGNGQIELVASQVDLWNVVDGIVEVLDLAGAANVTLSRTLYAPIRR